MRSKVIVFSLLLTAMAVSLLSALPPGGCFCSSVQQTLSYWGSGADCSAAAQDARSQALEEALNTCDGSLCSQALVIDDACQPGYRFDTNMYVNAHLSFKCRICNP